MGDYDYCDCDDGEDYVDPEEEFQRSIARLRGRVQKKRHSRRQREGRKALVRWLGRHKRQLAIPITGIVPAWRSPGAFAEIVFEKN
jgi:hypothetical protein